MPVGYQAPCRRVHGVGTSHTATRWIPSSATRSSTQLCPDSKNSCANKKQRSHCIPTASGAGHKRVLRTSRPSGVSHYSGLVQGPPSLHAVSAPPARPSSVIGNHPHRGQLTQLVAYSTLYSTMQYSGHYRQKRLGELVVQYDRVKQHQDEVVWETRQRADLSLYEQFTVDSVWQSDLSQ